LPDGLGKQPVVADRAADSTNRRVGDREKRFVVTGQIVRTAVYLVCTVGKTGAACANSGNTTRRTGRNGALPATAASIIASIRSVFERICRRSIGLGMSVWQAATA
jgi:hypothetical protein